MSDGFQERDDDWRLQVDVREPVEARSLTDELGAAELEHELSEAFRDRIIVSRDASRVFVYGGTRGQAERAHDLIEKLAEKHGWVTTIELRHWHSEAEEWEDPELPRPRDAAARAAEHEQLIAAEREQVEEGGEPEFEVRVDLPSRADGVRFAQRLRAEGLPAVRRWKYLVVGATDEDSARQLARRLESEAPGGSEVTVEGSGRVAYAERPANPFAVFGGLGG
jgi:hypothetical protein